MRINPDCIRELLIDIESNTTFNKQYILSNEDISDLINKYSYDAVLYHARYCYNAGLISGFFVYDSGGYFIIADLSPAGHSFLENIRNNNNWKKVKDILKKAGTFSLDLLVQTAAQVASNALSSTLRMR